MDFTKELQNLKDAVEAFEGVLLSHEEEGTELILDEDYVKGNLAAAQVILASLSAFLS